MQAWHQATAEEGSDTAMRSPDNQTHAHWWRQKSLKAQHN